MKFRKKPVVVDAVLWDGENHRKMFDFITDTSNKTMVAYHDKFYIDFNRGHGGLVLRSKKCDCFVNIGEYVIKDVIGELYPCKSDILAVSYERLE